MLLVGFRADRFAVDFFAAAFPAVVLFAGAARVAFFATAFFAGLRGATSALATVFAVARFSRGDFVSLEGEIGRASCRERVL